MLYLYRNGDTQVLGAGEMPLGLMPGMGYEEKETTLLAGESVLFCTDLAQGEFAKGNPEPSP
jgi:serine phosphatase RsbU (regulator of sigma subunit)